MTNEFKAYFLLLGFYGCLLFAIGTQGELGWVVTLILIIVSIVFLLKAIRHIAERDV